MKAVHSFSLTVDRIKDRVTIPLPQGSVVLSVGMLTADMGVLWYLGDSNDPSDDRLFRFAKTHTQVEDDVADNLRYLGVVHFYDGGLVYHAFEIVK